MPLPHSAYVWQRVWTPAVIQAVAATPTQFSTLRVLAFQQIGERRVMTDVDLDALAATGLPVRVVARIEGHRPPTLADGIDAELVRTLARWQARGVRVDGVEIDHDCAVSGLHDYAAWLAALRAALPAGTRLSITALPAWLDSDALDAVLAQADDSVLQVHAVERPDRALFDPARALRWARAYGQRAPHLFLLALPAYGLRVATDTDGSVRRVDAEGALDHAVGGRELRADPRDVASVLQTLRHTPVPRLDGVIWFRLPVAGDRRSWSTRTLSAVIAGEPPQARFRLQADPAPNGASDLWLRNEGAYDGAAPARLSLPSHCRSADGVDNYRMQLQTDTLTLYAAAPPWLRAGGAQPIGWARCDPPLATGWSANVP